MRIGIDARFFGPKNKGLGRYTQRLVENLEKIDSENEYVVFLRRENWDEFRPQGRNFKKVLADYKWYSLAEQVFMPFCIWRAKADLMHFPHFNVPFFYFGPFVMTIHDLILRRFPTRRASTLNLVKYWLKNLAYRLVIRAAIKKAKKIIAVSNYVREDILKFYRIDPEKIEMICEGAPEIHKNSPSPRFGNRVEAGQPSLESREGVPPLPPAGGLRGGWGELKPYLLYVGNAYPHKNLEKLIEAFAILKEKYKDLRLLLVGAEDYFYRRLKLEHGMDGVVFCGFVPDEDLAKLFQNASAYVFPSLCEGFGIPPLEAMAFGLPVASSSATCLPEILGQAAVYFDANDAKNMAEKIGGILDNENLRVELIERGFLRIKKYSWQEMARKTSALYKI